MARDCRTFDLADMLYRDLSKNSKGSPIVYMGVAGGGLAHPRLRLNKGRTPLVSPFGLSLFDPDSKGRHNFDIALDDPELLAYFVALDERNVQEAIRNKETWFKPGTGEAQIRTMYYPLVQRDEKHGKYAPQLRIKVNIDPGDRQVNVTRTSEDFSQYWRLTPDDLRAKFLRVFANIDVSCVWFQKMQFGMTLLLTDVNILSAQKKKELDFDWGGDQPKLAGADSAPPPPPPDVPPTPDAGISVLIGAKQQTSS